MIIYCIEDINDIKYIGKTTLKLTQRMACHRCSKKKNGPYSSKLLNLENCIIYQIEECNKQDSRAREKYWINNTECVNIMKMNFDRKKYQDEYDKKNRLHKNALARINYAKRKSSS